MKVCSYTVIKIDRSVLKLQTCSFLTHTCFSVARLTTRTPLKGYSRLKSSLFKDQNCKEADDEVLGTVLPGFQPYIPFIATYFLCCTRANVQCCTAWLVCYEGDRMTPQSGFYLNLFLTLNSTPLIGNKRGCSLLHLKGQWFFLFFSKNNKKKRTKTKCGVK